MNKLLKIGQITFCRLLAFTVLLTAGCASTKHGEHPETVASSDQKIAVRSDEVLAVGDLVNVKFSGTGVTNPGYEERIKEDGTITLPLIGAVKAVGKTSEDLQQEIRDRYDPDSFKRLSITVIAGENSYFIGGQVRSPGRQVFAGPTTVTRAIRAVGGFTEFAAQRAVKLIRSDGRTFRIDCRKALKDSSLDLSVYPGDKINVPMSDPPADMFL